MHRANWSQKETVVRRPGERFGFAIALLFFIVGVSGLIGSESIAANDETAIWAMRALFGSFAVMGGLVLAAALHAAAAPVIIQHADSTVLPDVPQEPILLSGWLAHGRITHELLSTPQGSCLAPRSNMWKADKRLLFGFGIPFSILFAGVLSWILHSQELMSWPLAITCGLGATAVCGGPAFLLIGLLQSAGYRQLCRLTIPQRDGDLELSTPEPIFRRDLDFSRIFRGPEEFDHELIPREHVVAVQLCPCLYVLSSASGRGSMETVQGVLVLRGAGEASYERRPLFITADAPSAARLMQQLAELLGVPFLFHANASGWTDERRRAKDRPPLQTGGITS